MRTKWFWNLLMMLVMALSMVGCGSDDDEKKDDEGGTTVTTEYTATMEVKEIKLHQVAGNMDLPCVIYKDFSHKYAFHLDDGAFRFEPYCREGGKWSLEYEYGGGYHNSYSRGSAGMISLGKVNGIADITEKLIVNDNVSGKTIALPVQPQCGYAVRFKTENDEWKYLRVYIKGYTLDDKEALSSITVQYQLY